MRAWKTVSDPLNIQLFYIALVQTQCACCNLLVEDWNEGDSLPLSCLPIGATVFCVQRSPDTPPRLACAGGSFATIMRHVDDNVVLRLPSKHEAMVSSKCTAVLGRAMLNEEAVKKMSKAGEKRWKGIRPKSGLRHKKDGRCGLNLSRKPKAWNYTQGRPAAPPAKRRLFNDLEGNFPC